MLIAAAVAAISFAGLNANAQAPQYGTTPGIVVAASQDVSKLPKKAKKFINKYFDGVSVANCEQNFAKGEYDVTLANGVDIEFNSKGDVKEIDAPDNCYIAPDLSKELLHDSAFAHLESQGLLSKVESIEFKRGRAVEVTVDVPNPAPDTYIYSVEGVFIGTDD